MRLNRRQTKGRTRKGAGLATPAQLVAAASEVFAAAGFRGATVRDICRQAGANVAAVNYHFGGKEGLYEEVLRCGLRQTLALFPPDGRVAKGASAEQRLRGFVRSFLQRLLATGPDACHGRLLMREMVDPTPALDAVVVKEIRALMEHLGGMVRELLGAEVSAMQVQLGAASVVSQVVFYHHCRPVIPRAFPGLEPVLGDLDALTDHIVRFSMAGLGQVARHAKPEGDRATPPRKTTPRRGSRT